MVSIFKHAKSTVTERNLSIEAYFDGIKNGQWQDEVLKYRTGKRNKEDKEFIHGVTASGTFKERASSKIVKHSGLICIDIDAKDQIAEIDIDAIKRDSYTYCVHQSLGGYGYAVYVKIDCDRHLDSFLGLEQYYYVNYSIVIDKSCKDVSRLRFVSYDPELIVNEKAKVFKQYLKAKEVRQKQYTPIVIKNDFEEMVHKASGMNLFDEYSDYIKLAFALASEFGANGEAYFHGLCQMSDKYDYEKASKHYQKACQRNGTGVSIATVYYKFKEAGISLTSEKTQAIKTAIKLSDNPTIYLQENGIIDDENLVEKLAETREATELDEIIQLIKMQGIRFNEISRNYEIKGEELNDRKLSQFYTLVWSKIDEGISKDKIWTLIQSRDNTPSFNPIHDFYFNNSKLITDNEFEKVKKCFTISASIFEDDKTLEIENYLDIYLKKWMLGIVGSSFGTYSLMILVLVGEQGIKKTEFFRNLLPKELHKYYAESNLDEGKDSEILMCKKLLIVDDEFGGKSKKDATKLKRLSSQQTFSIRAPYGRITEDLNRLAVLGGTSNDSEVINDPTGNRRIIPINLLKFDLEAFKAIDKNKLFLELYNEWVSDSTGWFLTPLEVEWLNKATNKNIEVWQELELLAMYCTPCDYNFMTCTDVKVALETKFLTVKTNTKRIGQSLKKLGFSNYMKRVNGNIIRVYNIKVEF